MIDEPEEERLSGLRAGQAWAEQSDDMQAVERIEEFIIDQEITFEELLAAYMRCIDPEGNLAEDDILDGFEADSRILTSDYLFGFVEGAQAVIREARSGSAN